MITVIGTTFLKDWQYGPDEIEIFDLTGKQVEANFSNQQNLLINTTWFGSQFNNNEWPKIEKLIADGQTFDNLFLLSVIDPLYLSKDDLRYIEQNLKIKNTYRIGMFDNSPFEWNFHAIANAKHCPEYKISEVLLTHPEYVFLLYQRKPRRHRVEITNLLLEKNLDKRGIITLGSNKNASVDWSEGLSGPVITIDDHPNAYKHNGNHDDFNGIPNDLVTLGRLDIWQQSFLNIASETEFNNWDPILVTEKTWKPMIGLRPFIVHGQNGIYPWLYRNGFKTFNRYWPHIPVEQGEDQHGNVVAVIEFLCEKSTAELVSMYNDMLPDLEYNRERFYEFSQEQNYKMRHLFE
jgi:hypothetical protein